MGLPMIPSPIKPIFTEASYSLVIRSKSNVVLFLFKQQPAHFTDLLQAADSCAQRVHLDGMDDCLTVLVHAALDDKRFDTRRCPNQNCKVCRQTADVHFAQTVACCKDRDLHAGILGQIFNAAVIEHIAVKLEGRLRAEAGVKDVRGIFAGLPALPANGRYLHRASCRAQCAC